MNHTLHGFYEECMFHRHCHRYTGIHCSKQYFFIFRNIDMYIVDTGNLYIVLYTADLFTLSSKISK